MFIYCLNNPINRTDTSGSMSITAVKAIAGAIVGGIVSATCALVTGASFKDVALAFLTGSVQGALSAFVDWGKYVVIIWNAVDVALDCYLSGADVGSSLLAGAVAILTSLSFIPECDLLTDILVDMTFGMGFSLISAGVTAGIKSNAATESTTLDKPFSNEQSDHHQGISYSQSASAGFSYSTYTPWRSNYNGPGWIYYERTICDNFRVPAVSNTSRIS